MPQIIRDTETQNLVLKLARLMGQSQANAVKEAVAEKLANLENARDRTNLADEFDRIALYCAGLPRRDNRNADAIVGYDTLGLFE